MRVPPPWGHGLIVTRCDRSPRRIHTETPEWGPMQYSTGTFESRPDRRLLAESWAPRRVGRPDYHAVVPRSGRRL